MYIVYHAPYGKALSRLRLSKRSSTPDVYAQQSNGLDHLAESQDIARSSGNTAKRRDQAGSDCAANAGGTRAKPVACRDPSGKPSARRLSPIRTRAHAKLFRGSSV